MTLTFHFREIDEMRKAIEMLPTELGPYVLVNAVLEKERCKYVREA